MIGTPTMICPCERCGSVWNVRLYYADDIGWAECDACSDQWNTDAIKIAPYDLVYY